MSSATADTTWSAPYMNTRSHDAISVDAVGSEMVVTGVTCGEKTAPMKRKMTVKAAEKIKIFEDKVKRGEFTEDDMKRMRVERSKFTNIPIHPRFRKVMESEEYKAMLRNPVVRTPRGPQPPPNCQEYHSIRGEEYGQYYKAIRASDGFDLPFLPFTRMRGGLRYPLHLALNFRKARRAAKYAKLALLHYNYNQEPRTDYELYRVVKGNGLSCVFYSITFLATSASNPKGDPVYFQARVRHLFTGLTIMLCRIRPKEMEKVSEEHIF